MKKYWTHAKDKTRLYTLELIDNYWCIIKVGEITCDDRDGFIMEPPTLWENRNTFVGALKWIKRLANNGVVLKELSNEEARRYLMMKELVR